MRIIRSLKTQFTHRKHQLIHRLVSTRYPLRDQRPKDLHEAINNRMAVMLQNMAQPPYEMELLQQCRLDPEDSTHGTYHLKLKLQNDSAPLPDPGDMVFIRWKNNPATVQDILSMYGEDGSRMVTFLGFSAYWAPGQIVTCDLRTALSEYIDLEEASMPLLNYAGLREAVRYNNNINKAHHRFHRDVKKKRVSVHDHPVLQSRQYSVSSVLASLPRLPDIHKLFDWQQRISGRAYTLAGSRRGQDGRVCIDITVSAVYRELFNAQGDKETQPARSSRYLHNLQTGEICSGWILPEIHKYPATLGRKPPKLIAIVTGSGISSPLSLLRSQETIEPVWLIYGVRSWKRKSLYGDEIMSYVQSGRICRLDIAESRPETEDGQKRYVQDILWANRRDIVSELMNGAHVYLCGRLSMGTQVWKIFKDMLIDQQITNNHRQAEQLMEEFSQRLIFQSSVSGV